MTDNAGKRLNEVISPIIRFYLAEAETSEYPYCVAERVKSEVRTKEGVAKITSNVALRIYGKNAVVVEQKAALVRAAVDSDMGSDFLVKFVSEIPDCVEDVWERELVFNIYQIQ